MNTAYSGPYGQDPQTTWQNPATSYQDEQVLVLSNGAYIPQSSMSDAQIAARKAMAKRSSRSFVSKVSRARSRKMSITKTKKPAKPTVDTSFSIHKGALPRQVFPKDNDLKSSGTIRKPAWFGRSKGLGIMKGTPQPEGLPEDFVAAMQQEPQTAATLTPGTRTWMEGVSPSDGPIPIGISLPTDSLPDLSPYQTTRNRSTSDAMNPSIIITPAAAMQSVWSPDTATESEYTPSLYSRPGTFRHHSNAPPVPALPDMTKLSNGRFGLDRNQEISVEPTNRSRNGTLDSAGTAFEDFDYDLKPKYRIMSSGTVFEEDEVPLRSRNTQLSTHSFDTTAAPTPTRPQSQGWWNFITTPFQPSPTSSVWNQNIRDSDRAPDVPDLPMRFGGFPDSPQTPSTYMWSATEKSPSVNGDYPMMPIVFSTTMDAMLPETRQEKLQKSRGSEVVHETAGAPTTTNNIQVTQNTTHYHQEQKPPANDRDITSPLSAMSTTPIVSTAAIGTVVMPRQVQEHQQQEKPQQQKQPQQVQQLQQPINVNIVFNDRRPDVNVQKGDAHSLADGQTVKSSPPAQPIVPVAMEIPTSRNAPSQSPPQFPLPPTGYRYGSPQGVRLKVQTSSDQSPQNRSLQFPPPPHFTQNPAHSAYAYGRGSGASSPVSTSELKGQRQKQKKQHRKVFNIKDWLPFGKRTRHDKNDHNGKKEKSRRKRWCWGCCCCLLILILLAILIPVIVVLMRKHNDDPKGATPTSPTSPPLGIDVPSQWLNLTGYPPIPTGISTIAQPEAVEEESGCIAPATAWSCAVPKEDQQAISPNKPDQPNLKFEITFENGTVSDPSKTRPARRAANPVSAGAFIRSLLNIRAAPSASPAAPATDDYKFLGQTTDGNQSPFEGEPSPFFISFLDTSNATTSPRLARRADNPGTDLTTVIPPPELKADGTAAPAKLFPLASGQPLRLFNREKDDEHYGFFVYYDRSIFLKETSKNFTRGGNPADQDGGSPFDAATQRCTWAQSRFLVQIWTRSQSKKKLLGSSSTPGQNAAFKRPGSFPYPLTITVDRHGGSATQKMAYCYKMETDGRILDLAQNKVFLFEDRTFGGTQVNPSAGPQKNVTGPIDGGSGGCRCQWQNWLE